MPNGSRAELPADAHLTLVTLGDVALRAGSATLFEIGKPLALVTYLACAPDRTVARGHLTDLLWGDVEPDAAKHALRQTLWYLKKRLGDRPLVGGGDTLTLVGQLECDRDGFLEAAQRGDSEAVVRLYTGDFFPGFAAPGGVEFERWADAERQRLRSIFWQHAEALARSWMSSARMKEAQALARRVRDLDPLREAGWRLLFEAIVAGSDTVAATAELASFERLCTTEGITPEPATRALLRALRQAPAPNEQSPRDGGGRALAAELVGREAEFSRIIAAWDAARGGRPSHVHVVATAGLGKTRLLVDAQARLRATRARTAFVRSTLGARDIPYGLAGELALALARLPGASGVSPGTARTLVVLNPAVSSFFPSAALDAREAPHDALRRRTAAIRELIDVLSEEQPLALFVDDLQWADDASRQVIAGISGTLDGSRALLVTAGRPMPDVLAPQESIQTIQLAPLSRSAVTALLASIAALPSESWAEQFPVELWQATAGSPLLILETLQLAMERDLLELVDGEWGAPKPRDLLAAMQAGGALRHRVERLDRPDRWLLTLLAVAGTPLSVQVAAAAVERTVDETALALAVLEQRGMVVRHGTLWSPSHDEIAAMAIELASDSAVRAAGRAAGRAITTLHGTDLGALRRAAVLLDRAQDWEGLAHAFNLFARGARSLGDRRPNVALVTDFVGTPSPEVTRRLVRTLPFTHRFGLYSTRRQVGAAVSVFALPLALGLLRATLGTAAPPLPEAVLMVGTIGEDSVARLYEVPIRGNELTPGQVIRPVPRGRPAWTLRMDSNYPGIYARPDGQAWAINRVSRDSGGIDPWEVSRDSVRRLADSPGDDELGSWSPDGRWLAFYTARWDSLSHYDLAIRDMRTGDVRRLTHTSDSDLGPIWSSDGSRLVFARRYWDRRATDLCVINFDGTGERCLNVSGAVAAYSSWFDTHRVFAVMSGDPQLIVRINVDAPRIDTIGEMNGIVRLSPDGRWILCECARPGFANNATLLFPADAPNRAIELDLSALPSGAKVTEFFPVPSRARYINRLAIGAGGDAMVGIPHALVAIGLTPEGDSIVPPVLRWSSADTSIATIDSSGILTPRRTGVVEVEVSAGGWRTGRASVAIMPRRELPVFTERWERGFLPRWRPFGSPAPRIDSAAGERGMMNAGDGSHVSGVYSDERYSTVRGLALDAEVYARITRDQWQTITLALSAELDSARLASWDHRWSSPPSLPSAHKCGTAFPGLPEGIGLADSIAFAAGAPIRQALAPRSFATGRWFRVRVQVFPDGRCGFAVNGIPMLVSPKPVLTNERVWVLALGNARWTTILVGETTLREGVPNDIDWSRASLSNPIPDCDVRHAGEC